jgi:hypothetical protein
MLAGAPQEGKVWRKCSSLAATSNTYKEAAAVYEAHTLLASLCDAGILPPCTHSSTAATHVLRPAITGMAKDIKQQLLASTLLLTNAALQLQAAAGVRAVTETQQDPACSTPSHPVSRAENQAVNMISLMFMIHHLTPVFSDSSNIGASCLMPAQHLAHASWQYLSTVPGLQPSQQDGQTASSSSSSQHSTVLTEAQLALSSLAWELTGISSNAVSAALESQHPVSHAASASTNQSAPVGREAGSPQGFRTPQASTADAAVRTRHYMECLCLQVVHLQLALLIKYHQRQEQQQRRASSSAAGSSAEQAVSDLGPQLPAPLQRMLRQLGCRPHAALWHALCMAHDDSNSSCKQIEEDIIQLTRRFGALRNHSKKFLIDSTPSDLPQSLLLETQQHLHLHKLLPGVLLQWVADKPSSSSNYSQSCHQAGRAAVASGNLYHRVLQDGPASLYQHMTGHSQIRPQLSIPMNLPADLQLTTVVPISADVLESQLQLLEQLLTNLLQLWRTKHGGKVQPASISSNSNSSVSSSSNQYTGRSEVDSDLLQAVYYAGSLTFVTAELPPAQESTLETADIAEARKQYTSAASSTAGLCSMLENVSRMELAADQQAAVAAMMATARRFPASNNTQRWKEEPLHWSLHERFRKLAGIQAGPLVDPILAHYGPGSKPCMQLCSLLATMLKCSAWDSCCPEALASDAAADSPGAFRPVIYAEANRAAVCGAACAVVEAATAQVTVCQVPASGASGSSSTCNGSSRGAEVVLPWLVLLGRCCLQWGQFIQAELSKAEAAGMSAADIRLFGAGLLAALRGEGLPQVASSTAAGLHSGQRASIVQNVEAAVAIGKAWLSAGSHATQLAVLGYDAEGLMQQLCSAEASVKISKACIGLSGGAQPDDVLQELQKQLQSVGMVLTSFAQPIACNNPLCSNPAEFSEAELVQSKTSRCSGCRAAKYCGKQCQVSHWKQHKHVCKQLAAAAATAAFMGPGADKGG